MITRIVAQEIVATFIGFFLAIQSPPTDRYSKAELIQITNPSRNRYEYTIVTREDGYVGRSSKLIHVQKGSEVRFAIRGRTLYVIDLDGKIQQLRYTRQFLRPPDPRPRNAN